MAYKFNTNYGGQTLGARTGGSGLDAGAKALQKSFDDNLAAEKALRLSDLTNRQELNNTINSYGNASNDKAFNDANTQMLLGMADEYAKVTDALARGTVDVAEGTAYQSQLKSALDMYGKFVVSSKSLEDQINAAGGFDRGATGSLILGGGINDGQTLNMIHRLWNNPDGLEFTRDGNGMYLRDKASGKVINAEQFVQALENGRSLGETVPDVNETVNTAFKTIDTNPAFGAYKRQQQYTSANGTTTTSTKYDKEMLREAFTKADPWQPLIDNATQANGTWEYLMHLDGYKDRVMASNNGLWVGNEIDQNGNFTDIAQTQQKLMKEMLTDLAIDKNVPNSDLITTSISKKSTGTSSTDTETLKAQQQDFSTKKTTYNLFTQGFDKLSQIKEKYKDKAFSQDDFMRDIANYGNEIGRKLSGQGGSFRVQDTGVLGVANLILVSEKGDREDEIEINKNSSVADILLPLMQNALSLQLDEDQLRVANQYLTDLKAAAAGTGKNPFRDGKAGKKIYDPFETYMGISGNKVNKNNSGGNAR